MGAGGSSGNPRSKTHQYLENAATAIPLLLKRQSASECRVIAERLGQLKEEVEYIALSKDKNADAVQSAGSPDKYADGVKSARLPVNSAQTSKWDMLGATSLKNAFAQCDLIDAAWLVTLADKGETVPRNQDVPRDAIVSLKEMEAWDDPYTLGVIVVSYPWLDQKKHPDPNGDVLRKMSLILNAYAAKARAVPGCRVGVFWSYCSLPQQHEDGTEDRDEDQLDRFMTATTMLSVLPRYISAGYILCLGMWTPMLQPDVWCPFPESSQLPSGFATPFPSPAPTPNATPVQIRRGGR